MGLNPGQGGERPVTTALAMAVSLRRSNLLRTAGHGTGSTFVISTTEQLSVAHRLPACYHHYLIFQLKLITPLQITYGYDVTQTPCSTVTLKPVTDSQSKGITNGRF